LGPIFSIAQADTPATQPSVVQSPPNSVSLEAANATLLEKVRVLETKVDSLENRQAQSQADVTAAIQDVLKNADRQSKLFDQNDLASGYDPAVGFVIRSDDGAFTLNPHLLIAARNETNYRERIAKGGGGETGAAGYDVENGFEITRLRLVLQGNFTKQITYFVQFSADQGNTPFLVDAYATYRLGQSPFSLRAGQFKDPLWHERNLSEGNLMAVDRTILETLLGGEGTANSRVQGVALLYDQDRVRGQLVLHDGFASLNTKFFDAGGIGAGVSGASGVTADDFGVSGRADFLAIGDRTTDYNPFTQYDGGFTSLGAKQDTLVLGGGADFTQAGSNDLLLHTIDAQYNSPGGLSLYAAYLGSYRDLHTNQGVAPGKYYDPGFMAQVAYLVTDRIEPFARYDYTFLAHGSTTGLADSSVQEITIGANYYLYKQNAKFTLDGTWLPVGSPVDADNLGILKDSGHNEFIVRAQLQLAL
jgi:hypothetical protein